MFRIVATPSVATTESRPGVSQLALGRTWEAELAAKGPASSRPSHLPAVITGADDEAEAALGQPTGGNEEAGQPSHLPKAAGKAKGRQCLPCVQTTISTCVRVQCE